MTDANDRVAVVTGGSRGIGRAISMKLAGEGHQVVVNYAGNETAAAETVKEITENGGRAIAIRGDVSDEAVITSLFDRVEAEFGGVDVVVNAAGIMPLSPLADLDLAVLDNLLRVNVRGTFVVDQQAVRRLRPGGALVNISSSLTRFARPGYSAYAASKGAVEAMTLILARELRGRDVTVNAVALGPTATELFYNGKSDEVIQRIAAEPPLERIGLPTDAAEVVSFLAGPGRWVNGQVIHVNGGAI